MENLFPIDATLLPINSPVTVTQNFSPIPIDDKTSDSKNSMFDYRDYRVRLESLYHEYSLKLSSKIANQFNQVIDLIKIINNQSRYNYQFIVLQSFLKNNKDIREYVIEEIRKQITKKNIYEGQYKWTFNILNASEKQVSKYLDSLEGLHIREPLREILKQNHILRKALADVFKHFYEKKNFIDSPYLFFCINQIIAEENKKIAKLEKNKIKLYDELIETWEDISKNNPVLESMIELEKELIEASQTIDFQSQIEHELQERFAPEDYPEGKNEFLINLSLMAYQHELKDTEKTVKLDHHETIDDDYGQFLALEEDTSKILCQSKFGIFESEVRASEFFANKTITPNVEVKVLQFSLT